MEFESNYASELFDQFLNANTMRVVITQFKRICNFLDIQPTNFDTFYPRLKSGITNNWKAQSIFNKLDKKASNKIYLQNQRHEILKGQKCLIIGGGPCGLRTAIELQLLGADHVLVIEKRDRMSRNNSIHLWPMIIHDLKELAGKKINAKFCSGSIDHVSIRQLQMMLLKVALILGCDFVDNVGFSEICPLSIQQNVKLNEQCCCSHHLNHDQPIDNQQPVGAYAHFTFNSSSNYPEIVEKLETYSFNILIGAGGRRNLLNDFFPRKEFRGKLAIAITANFINNHTLAEAQVPEISGISFIYYQQLFKSLKEQLKIDLENICYYKDDCHYLVMTIRKASLLARGVLLEDYQDTRELLSPNNINKTELLSLAKDTATWATGLSNLKFALNHHGCEDTQIFDFTSMYCAENACRVKEIYQRSKCCKQQNGNNVRTGHLLLGLVGDSLLEPFWPTGSGCGRGFLSAMDAAWFTRQFALKCLSNGPTTSAKEKEDNILSVISERESIYRLLAQTKPENLNLNFSQYTLNPITRYPNLNSFTIEKAQCKHLLYSNVRKTVQNRQTLAEKRARRITIACTPETLKQQYIKQQQEHHLEIEESPQEPTYDQPQSRPELINNVANNKFTGVEYLANNKHYMTPSAFNLQTLERSRNKEIESVIKHRKQREERLTQECLSSEERYMNHVRKQVKPKADWFLNYSKTENSYESNTSSNRSNNSSQEDLRNELPSHYSNHFSSKVRDLEFKLNGHNSFNEERYLKNEKSNRNADGVNVMAARLQDLLDPIKQEAKFKEEVKRKAFLEKDYKFVGKLSPNDWNVKLFNGDKDEETKSDKVTDKMKPRPRERVAIFKEKLHNIENVLKNGKSKTDDEVNRLTKKQLQQFETRRTGNRCGEWIEKLKSELSDKQQSNTHKKSFTNKPFARKRIDDEDNRSEGNTNQFRRPNVEYIQYVKLNKPIITIKQNESKFHSLDRTKLNHNKIVNEERVEGFGSIESNNKITYMKDLCARCNGKVITIDKLLVNGTLFHRNCLKCMNCGSNLRLSELRQANNVIDEKNTLCSLCSNENNRINKLTRSNSTSNYSARLKERIKWKESFLLNLDSAAVQQAKNQINERIEYENASNELLDDEEVTKLLNLDSIEIGSSQSSDVQYNNTNNLSSDEEEDETTEETSTDTSDTTGADINSDQFDFSELESPKSEKASQLTDLPEIKIVNEDQNENNSSSDDEETLNNQTSSTINRIFTQNDTTNQITSTNSNNTLNDFKNCINSVNIPERSKTISDISEVELSEADDTDNKSTTNRIDHQLVNESNFKSFKVEIPKLLFTQSSTNRERYSKIPVLNDRILEDQHQQKTIRPIYQGTFTEKVLKSRSSPTLNENSLRNFSSFKK